MLVPEIILICAIFAVPIESAKILAVFPVASISHQVAFRPVTQELAKRGHEVVVITPNPAFSKDVAPANLTEIDTHEVSYKLVRKIFTNAAPKGRKSDMLEQIEILLRITILYVEQILNHEEVKVMIEDKNQKFDLILVEMCSKPALIFSHIFDAPVVQISSFGAITKTYETFGAPEHPLVYPLALNLRINNLSKWEKIMELYNHYQLLQITDKHNIETDEMFKKIYGSAIDSVKELEKRVDMIFLNIHPLFEGIRPVPPTVKYIAGLHQNPQKDLPKDLKQYLDASKNGVIYFSLGTNVDPTLLSKEKILLFLNVLSKLPYDVLWKWNGDELPGRSSNIRISKWLPQSDLLRHPKIKVFITQGGLQSTDEAITARVPLVGIPMLGDQWFNVERYVYHKIGVGLDFETITEEEFRTALLKVIEDNSYRENIRKLRNLMKDEPETSLDRCIWWIEYVIRHGGAKHLRSSSADTTWSEYLVLDVVLILLITFLIVCSLISLTVYLLRGALKSYVTSQKIKVS